LTIQRMGSMAIQRVSGREKTSVQNTGGVFIISEGATVY
jgi:hypothetical protein